MSQALSLKTQIASGTLIDKRYIIQKILGQGGLGRTYLALDTHRFNEACVLKEFVPIVTGHNQLEKCRSLFKREAKILYQFKHRQIPRFFSCFEGDGRLFLVQEFVNGKAYSTLLLERQRQGKTFSEQEVIQWLKNLLPVLRYIHHHHIIHRDISPENIMLPKGKNLPVLIDFGLGKQIANIENSNQAKFVGKMSIVGKFGYAPPEQISLGLCFPCSDIYALGVTALVLLTGKNPSWLMKRYTSGWKWDFHPNISKDFALILDKMLLDMYTKRYQTSEELLMDLESLRVTQIATSDFESQKKHQLALKNVKNVENLPTASSNFENIVKYSEELAPTILAIPSKSKIMAGSSLLHNSPKKVFCPPLKQGTSQNQESISLKTAFIQRCQEELAYYVGPIASLIVEEILVKNPNLVPDKFIEFLSREIPNSQEAAKFNNDLMKLVKNPN